MSQTWNVQSSLTKNQTPKNWIPKKIEKRHNIESFVWYPKNFRALEKKTRKKKWKEKKKTYLEKRRKRRGHWISAPGLDLWLELLVLRYCGWELAFLLCCLAMLNLLWKAHSLPDPRLISVEQGYEILAQPDQTQAHTRP